VANQRARELRRQLTDAEQRLWSIPRLRQVDGLKFRRQVPIGRYIADFVCLEQRLVIEVDGGQHADRAEQDAVRTAWLRTHGFEVLRFWNNDVLGNLDGVRQAIHQAIRAPDDE
jgi:very-short-patch-repair endonuclease